jgi:predicted transcriptional regulator
MSGDGSHHADGGGTAPGWETIARQLADRYRVHVDSATRPGDPRYVAVARSLNVRPYAVVTTDPAELLHVLGCADIPAMPSARPGAAQ